MRDATGTVTFWVLLAFAFAALVIFDSHLWLLHTMLASANVGAKCVRAEKHGPNDDGTKTLLST